MKKLYSLIILFMLSVSPVFAADYYVCDTTENTGSDANDGSLANPWLTMDKALSEIDALSGGDNLYFCEGFTGSSTADNIIASTGSCDEATPCAVGIYTPAGQDVSDDGVAPILQNTTYDVLKFDGGILEDGGYSFTGLHLVGGGSVDCVSVVDGFSNLDLLDIEYDSCDVAVNLAVVADQVSVGVNVNGAVFTSVGSVGYKGSSNQGSLINVTMDDTSLLLQGINTSDFTVREIYSTGSTCTAPVIQAQGSFRGLYFVEPHVTLDQGTAGLGCYGIALDQDYGAVTENFNYVMLVKATVAWAGTYGIYCPNCTNVYLDHNIVVGDDDITSAIDISGANSKYVSSYKNYIVLINEDTSRTALNITASRSSFTKNQIFVNDADDVCINAGTSVTYDDNLCFEAVVGGLLDREIE